MLKSITEKRWARPAAAAREAGQAMIIVLASLALMATIPLVVIATTANQLPLTTGNVNWNAAYQAAQAGLNDYIQHLDLDDTYTQWTSSHNGCSTANPPVITSDVNPAFCGWVTVATNPNEYFQYSASTSNGELWLTVSGLAGATALTTNNTSYSGNSAIVRTFKYSLVPKSTLDDLFWTNYSQVDPNLYGLSSGTSSLATGPVVFSNSDTLNGPVYSNDDIYICGTPDFAEGVTSANAPGGISANGFNNNGDQYATQNGAGQYVDGTTGGPYWVSECEEGVPQTGTSTLTVGSGYCANSKLPACVTFGSQPQVIAPPADDVTPAKTVGCYINATSGVTFTLSGTKLSWSGTGATVSNSSGNTNSCGSSGGSAFAFSNLSSALFYVNGNVTINSGGSVQGFLTIVSSGNITLDGSVTYPCSDIQLNSGGSCSDTTQTQTKPASDSSDALGLIAQDSVIVSASSNASVTIDAAMAAISDSFYNANFGTSCGTTCNTLTLFGSVAQNYTGAVGQQETIPGTSYGTVVTGYQKAYWYDSSLETLWTPYFLAPLDATWNATGYAECVPGPSDAVLGGSPHC